MKMEESKGDIVVGDSQESISFNDLISAVVGNYFEDRLYEHDIKQSYIKCFKDNKNYKKTQAYIQAKSSYGAEEVKFRKNQCRYGGMLIV